MALLSGFLVGTLAAITTEVVRVFVPLSFHETDTAIETGPAGELVQARVVTRTMVLSGAFPEDLVKAVALPYQLPSNNSHYKVPDANLVALCGLTIDCTREGSLVEVNIDCQGMKSPDFLELELKQVLEMTIESVRRTLRTYYRENEHEPFECYLTLSSLTAEQVELKALETHFEVG